MNQFHSFDPRDALAAADEAGSGDAAASRRAELPAHDGGLVDPWTGLANRRGLDAALLNALAASRFAERPLSVVVLAIDGLEAIDDRFGPAVGDRVLREVAVAMSACARPGDIVARSGGGTFVHVLAEATAARAVDFAVGLRDAITARDWSAVAPGLAVGVATGVAEDPGRGSVAALLREAEAALAGTRSEPAPGDAG
jgi:diguanylate cyclase (GGDEF)-like protein